MKWFWILVGSVSNIEWMIQSCIRMGQLTPNDTKENEACNNGTTPKARDLDLQSLNDIL